MNINGLNTAVRRYAIKIGNAKLCDLERVIQQSDGDSPCCYCNYDLKCGRQECVWQEGGI